MGNEARASEPFPIPQVSPLPLPPVSPLIQPIGYPVRTLEHHRMGGGRHSRERRMGEAKMDYGTKTNGTRCLPNPPL